MNSMAVRPFWRRDSLRSCRQRSRRCAGQRVTANGSEPLRRRTAVGDGVVEALPKYLVADISHAGGKFGRVSARARGGQRDLAVGKIRGAGYADHADVELARAVVWRKNGFAADRGAEGTVIDDALALSRSVARGAAV